MFVLGTVLGSGDSSYSNFTKLLSMLASSMSYMFMPPGVETDVI